MIVRGMPEAIRQLLNQRYTCVIVDEAHRARRRNRPKHDAGQSEVDERADPNKLMLFLCQIGEKTKSMLLATATPVQLHPVEAWDLLSILSNGNEGVLGGITKTSRWFSAYRTIQIATGEQKVPADDDFEGWQFVMDPLPAASEDPAIEKIRRQLRAPDKRWQFRPDDLDKLPNALRRVQLKNKLLPDYGERFNPMLRCIVRRTRSYLEQEVNPNTGSYYLPKVEVKLFGEADNDAISLGGYLKEAYEEAETFSELLQKRVRGAGFFKTLLLRRLGSSMEAGRNTVSKLLNVSPETDNDEDEDDIDEDIFGNEGQPQGYSEFRNFSTDEITSLERCLMLLKQGGNRDPKLEAILGYLLGSNPNTSERWIERGCIPFSQYYDTVRWVGEELAKHPDIPSELTIGLYAGSNRSGFWLGGRFQRCDRTLLKNRVRKGEIKLLLGTDAASEGLNLQRLGTLINIDLPWNPTRPGATQGPHPTHRSGPQPGVDRQSALPRLGGRQGAPSVGRTPAGDP